MHAFVIFGHAVESNGNAQVAPNAGIQPFDVFGDENRSPLDTYRVGLRRRHCWFAIEEDSVAIGAVRVDRPECEKDRQQSETIAGARRLQESF